MPIEESLTLEEPSTQGTSQYESLISQGAPLRIQDFHALRKSMNRIPFPMSHCSTATNSIRSQVVRSKGKGDEGRRERREERGEGGGERGEGRGEKGEERNVAISSSRSR